MAETILTIFRRNALRLGSHPCLHFKENNTWKQLSWVDAEERVRRYTLGLSALGLKPGGKAAILSETRMEWTLLDLSVLACQGICVPLYPTLSADQMAYILKDSQCSLLIVENLARWEKLAPVLKDWKYPVVLIEGDKDGFYNLRKLIDIGKSLPVNQYDENLKQIQLNSIATIVYTSGTTGPPKGGMLSHGNLMAEVLGLEDVFRFEGERVGLMSLPLAHVIARAMQFYQLAQGCQAAYAESLELLPANLREVRPHFMAAVPRLLEKSYEKVQARVRQGGRMTQKIFDWSAKVGAEWSELKQKKLSIPFWLILRWEVADFLVFRKIRKGFGGRLLCIISGGAPLAKNLAQFFHGVGILVVEGYGLTETFAAITLNRLDDYRFGTVGKPLEGARIKINEEGEICVKGETVFAGYWGKKEETQSSFDKDQWFLTGDIGEFTKDGFLRITDRKKDIIVTSGGKKVAPQNIENMLQQGPYIQQVIVHGEGKKYLSALITLNWDSIRKYAKEHAISFFSNKDLAENEQIQALVHQEIDTCNQHLSSFETIKKFAILDNNFSVETGELTPTMKVKRKMVADKYKTVLDQLYLES